MIYEFPPMPKGTTEEQVKDLRDYLVRLVQQLNEQDKQPTPTMIKR